MIIIIIIIIAIIIILRDSTAHQGPELLTTVSLASIVSRQTINPAIIVVTCCQEVQGGNESQKQIEKFSPIGDRTSAIIASRINTTMLCYLVNHFNQY